jgi:cytochrome c-type protein NapC
MLKKRIYQFTAVGILVFAVGAAATGAAALGAFGGTIAYSNSFAFCTSCHEMHDNNYAEYKDTIHARNPAGVKAICSDCHVPHDLVGLMIHKVGALTDLMYHFEGTIDTRQKFVDHRLVMAKKVWLHMKQTDSQECRNCHDQNAMVREEQGRTAQKQHKHLFDHSGATCIDCHYGIAHKLPPGDEDPSTVFAEANGTAPAAAPPSSASTPAAAAPAEAAPTSAPLSPPAGDK